MNDHRLLLNVCCVAAIIAWGLIITRDRKSALDKCTIRKDRISFRIKSAVTMEQLRGMEKTINEFYKKYSLRLDETTAGKYSSELLRELWRKNAMLAAKNFSTI